ncbi:hypothetical protein OE749_14160 [Aestuariibacter sp. AA17]|uniref:Uncharacterized protein n=1 Tax=Fluctibacter corallii TaxID=2984329 RepID=A0ABT3AB29_9ALTE|nr:hypothetical protein [Aestuariibacter sp. AA17]MCV2885838.1 hypothetical protein [Aestuariibacter sp. AA17]
MTSNNAPSATFESKTSKNNFAVIAFIIAFILPVILAKFALDYDWFNRGATNKGELLNPALDFSPINSTHSQKWRIAYIMPTNCDQSCENAIFSLSQLHQALGKEQDRVESVIVWTPNSDVKRVSDIAADHHFALLMSEDEKVNNVFNSVETGGIFIIDTLDNVILRYPIQQQKQEAVLKSRDILSDLRKLLKLSRIG